MRRALKSTLRRVGLKRERIAAVRLCCERVALSRLRRDSDPTRPRILCYHSVGTPSWGVNDVEPRRFRCQLERALEAGYTFASAEHIARGGGQPRELAITFDDGLMSVATNAAPILAELGIPWTLFVVSDWADGHHPFGGTDLMLGWRDIEHLASLGVTIGSHSVSHANFAWLGPSEAAFELGESRRVIEARTGIRPSAFAIPRGTSRDWTPAASDAARAVGYELVYAQSESNRPPGSVPRTFVTRFDSERIFDAVLGGAFDEWEEWR
jgi:peptidoglycan/xylan/chitin deacetylase (PgdA/CDA1 family)